MPWVWKQEAFPPVLREPPGRLTPPPQLFKNSFPSGTRNQHEKSGSHPHGYGVWGMVGGQSEMPLHPLTIKKQFLSSPGFPFAVVSFWLDFRVLQKLTLTVFTSSLVVLGKEWSPGLPYSTDFGCPAPFEHSFYVWGNSYIVSLNIPKMEAQDLFSLSPLQPVVHLHPSKIGPVSQKYIKT